MQLRIHHTARNPLDTKSVPAHNRNVEPSTVQIVAFGMTLLSVGIAVTRFFTESPLFQNKKKEHYDGPNGDVIYFSAFKKLVNYN